MGKGTALTEESEVEGTRINCHNRHLATSTNCQPQLPTAIASSPRTQVKLDATEAMIVSNLQAIRIAVAAQLVNRCNRYLSSPHPAAAAAAAATTHIPSARGGEGSTGGESEGGALSAGTKRRHSNSGGGFESQGQFEGAAVGQRVPSDESASTIHPGAILLGKVIEAEATAVAVVPTAAVLPPSSPMAALRMMLEHRRQQQQQHLQHHSDDTSWKKGSAPPSSAATARSVFSSAAGGSGIPLPSLLLSSTMPLSSTGPPSGQLHQGGHSGSLQPPPPLHPDYASSNSAHQQLQPSFPSLIPSHQTGRSRPTSIVGGLASWAAMIQMEEDEEEEEKEEP